jgi:hypothetical protein
MLGQPIEGRRRSSRSGGGERAEQPKLLERAANFDSAVGEPIAKHYLLTFGQLPYSTSNSGGDQLLSSKARSPLNPQASPVC